VSRGRTIVLGLLAALAVGLAAGFWGWVLPTRRAVDVGAAMLAKQVCSCVYLANREVADCRADEFQTLDPIQLEVLRDEERVRAWIPGLGERTASFREGMGCTLD